ncbi:Folliculin-interacting protein 1 [Entomortierella chlamydospora]|nr:Folliculin-interacting protein 1 [Entomortierella chlamydospora]
MCQEVSSIQDIVLFDSQQVSGSDFNQMESPSPSPARSSFKSSSMNSLFGSLRSERSLPSNLSSSQTMSSRRPTKLIPSIIPKLMFGTTPLAYKGSTSKIHLLNEPAQIMLTKTFSIHPTDITAYTAVSTRRGSFSSNNSNSTVEISGMSTISGHGDYRSHPRASRPMTAFIPESAYTREESKVAAVSSSLPNASHIRTQTPRPGFDVRRMRRASQTSMENGTFNPMPLPSSFSHLDGLGNPKPALTQAARSKSFSIAVFIVVNNNNRLREFKTGLSGNGTMRSIPDLARLSFQQDARLQEAVARLQQAIYQLYSAPRIQAPLWLNINTYPSKKAAQSNSFMTELIHLMEESPASGQLVSEGSRQGSYDPLWAQLSDLYGNIGTVSRISRTIVVGSNGSFVRRLLYILSYFIRCNEVFLRITEFKEDPDSLLNPPPPSRTTYDLPEDHESGSPATMMRSISIPKRPNIDTFAARGSSISRSMSSRLTSIGEPTTPILPTQSHHLHDRDKPIAPSATRRPLFDTAKPRLDSKDSISTESTPFHSRPTTPTTIESRPDSDRGEESGHQQSQLTPSHHLRVDTTKSRTFSSDTLGSDAPRSAHDSGCATQEVLANVPLPVTRVVCSFPPFPSPSMAPAANGAPSEDKVLPADVLFCKSYGRSLMAPYCDRYMSDFALMGVPKFDFQHFMETDMRDTLRHFEIQERIAMSVCIVADTNTMKCNVFCAKPPPPLPPVLETGDLRGGLGGVFDREEPVTRLPHVSPSLFIDTTLHQMVDLAHNGLAAEQAAPAISMQSNALDDITRRGNDEVVSNSGVYGTITGLAPL